MERSYNLFRYVDAPNKTLIWENDSVVTFIFPILVSLWADAFLIGLLSSCVLCYLSTFIKKKFGRGGIMILKYWYLYQAEENHNFPSSVKREFIG